jgi:DUF1365 family protein
VDGVLYLTEVMHRRVGRPAYRFAHPVFSLLVDIDRLDELPRRLRLLSVDRWNLLSIRRRDHGPRDGGDWRSWVESRLAEAGVDLHGGRIRLLCLPRLLGYAFNPISLWYCEHRDGTLRAVIAEVNNTFGDHHHYVLHGHGEPLGWPLRARAAKCMHVSPLIDMDCEYRFRLAEPGDRLSVFIRQFRAGRFLLAASQTGESRPLTDRQLLRALARTPLMTFKVMAAIHWQALKIWLRGGRFHRRLPPPPKEASFHGADA